MAKRNKVKKSLFINYKDDEGKNIGGNYSDYLQFCESVGLPYTIIESNYRLIIKSDFCNIDFMQNIMSNKAFIAGAMVLRDIKKTGLTPPDIDKNDLKYFDFTPPKYLKDAENTIYNIDIKSAYATVLYTHSLINKKTFGYMAKLPKKDRLACVGMLASKKEYFEMEGSEAINFYSEEKESKNWFYFCIQRTALLMDKCRAILGNDFLFYWVDGIFFRNKSHAEKIIKLLHDEGYKCSFDTCYKFNYTDKEKEKVVKYWKMDENKGIAEFKRISLPKKNDSVNLFLIDFISQLKNIS